jgi:hypothetical protein
MDTASKSAIQLLETMGKNRTRLAQIAEMLKEKSGVLSTSSGLQVQQYPDECVIEGYISTELSNGSAIDWWLEVHWNSDEWIVSSETLRNTPQGQDVVEIFPDNTTKHFDENLEFLGEAIQRFEQSVDAIDLMI